MAVFHANAALIAIIPWFFFAEGYRHRPVSLNNKVDERQSVKDEGGNSSLTDHRADVGEESVDGEQLEEIYGSTRLRFPEGRASPPRSLEENTVALDHEQEDGEVFEMKLPGELAVDKKGGSGRREAMGKLTERPRTRCKQVGEECRRTEECCGARITSICGVTLKDDYSKAAKCHVISR